MKYLAVADDKGTLYNIDEGEGGSFITPCGESSGSLCGPTLFHPFTVGDVQSHIGGINNDVATGEVWEWPRGNRVPLHLVEVELKWCFSDSLPTVTVV